MAGTEVIISSPKFEKNVSKLSHDVPHTHATPPSSITGEDVSKEITSANPDISAGNKTYVQRPTDLILNDFFIGGKGLIYCMNCIAIFHCFIMTMVAFPCV